MTIMPYTDPAKRAEAKRRSRQNQSESEEKYLTEHPAWLGRETVLGGKYAVVEGRCFEVTRGRWMGYHIDRIDRAGYYLAETIWVEKYADIRPTMEDWHNRKASANFDEDDILGDEDGNITKKMRSHLSRSKSPRKSQPHKSLTERLAEQTKAEFLEQMGLTA